MSCLKCAHSEMQDCKHSQSMIKCQISISLGHGDDFVLKLMVGNEKEEKYPLVN